MQYRPEGQAILLTKRDQCKLAKTFLSMAIRMQPAPSYMLRAPST